jgi:hypothetical protein
MSHYYVTPAEFKQFVEDFGYLSAITNMAAMAEEMPDMDPVTKDYILIEARRLIRAVDALEEVDDEQ